MSTKTPETSPSVHESRQDSEDKEERDEDTRSGAESQEEPESGEDTQNDDDTEASAPPLPAESIPPLPNEAPPGQVEDDGWDPVWDDTAQAFYFYNRFTALTQWENPRVPEAAQPTAPGVGNHDRDATNGHSQPPPRATGGYDPAIHGDYDPNADYAQAHNPSVSDEAYTADPSAADPNMIYTATGQFNRFTGKWQAAGLTPENFNDDNKSRRQMSAFFDVDAAANSHDGKSLKAERSGKKLTKAELKAFKDKRREKKEEKRRAWLRD